PTPPPLRVVEAESDDMDQFLQMGRKGIGSKSPENLPPTADEAGSGLRNGLRDLESGLLKKVRKWLKKPAGKGSNTGPAKEGRQNGVRGGGSQAASGPGRLAGRTDDLVGNLDKMCRK